MKIKMNRDNNKRKKTNNLNHNLRSKKKSNKMKMMKIQSNRKMISMNQVRNKGTRWVLNFYNKPERKERR